MIFVRSCVFVHFSANGASLCFITNEKAREERLEGTRVDLSIVNVGGANVKLPTYKYKLPLIDEQGQEVLFNVYGIEKITSDIQAVNLDGVTDLFNVPREEITRPNGSVDVRIRYEYAGFYPEKEQSSRHLLLLKNRFGRCIGGSHFEIEESNVSHKLDTIQAGHVMSPKVEDFYNVKKSRH